MKRLFLALLAAVCVIMAAGLTGCAGKTDESGTGELPGEGELPGGGGQQTNYIDAGELVFGYNADDKALARYFEQNGTLYDPAENVYVIAGELAAVYYDTDDREFELYREITKKRSLSNYVYEYSWASRIKIRLWDTVENAEFAGAYSQSTLDMNSLNVVAYYIAGIMYEVKDFKSESEICDFSAARYVAEITDAADYGAAKEHFEAEREGETVFSGFQPCIQAVREIFSEASGVEFSNRYDAANYENIDFSQTVFSDVTVRFGGEAVTALAENGPKNVLTEYEGNVREEPGIFTAKVTFKDPKGVVLKTLTAKMEITDIYNVTVRYALGKDDMGESEGYIVGEQRFSAKYGADILPLCAFPEGFVHKDTSQSVFPETYSWSGYCDQIFTVSVRAEYEGYICVRSDTNYALDGQIIPFEDITAFETTDSLQSTVPFGGEESILFRFSDIKSVKFMNTEKIDSVFGTAVLENLESVDMSECVYLEYIPDNFFEGCKKLHTVTAPVLPELKEIGNDFLRDTDIVNFDFDISGVRTIGMNFMSNALGGERPRTIVLDLKSIENINTAGLKFLYNKAYTGQPVVNVYLYDYIMKPYDFDKNTYANLYFSVGQIDIIAEQFKDYSNIRVFSMSEQR